MISIKTPKEISVDIANKAKSARLSLNYSRKTLSVMSGVPAPTIRRFEDTGEIALLSLLNIAFSLDMLNEFHQLFNEKEIVDISQIGKTKRERGRS